MAQRKRFTVDELAHELREQDRGETKEDYTGRIIRFYRNVDFETAEQVMQSPNLRWLISIAKAQCQPENKSVLDLMTEKVLLSLSKKPPEQLLQFFAENLSRLLTYPDLDTTRYYPVPRFGERLLEFFFEQLRSNLDFRNQFLEHPSSARIEAHLFEYCSQHESDKEMREIQAVYKHNRQSPEDRKRRELYFSDPLRELYGFPKAPAPLDDFQQDLIKVALFLMDSERVVKRLQQLEKLIENAAKEHKLKPTEVKDGQPLLLPGYKKGEPYKDYKLLSSVLYALAKSAGFQEPLKLDKQLSSEEFYQMLAKGSLFKDRTLGGRTHGEWTHFIQWMCIVLEHAAEKDFLKHDPVKIYQWIGEHPGKGLWGNTCEGPPNLLSGIDFRNFDHINRYLLFPQFSSSLPLLHQLVLGRAEKREQQIADKEILDSLERLCDRNLIYHKPYFDAVQELLAIITQKSTKQASSERKEEGLKKSAKPMRIISIFEKKFEERKKEFPPDFVESVEKELSPLKKRNL